MWLMLFVGALFVGTHLGISSTGLRKTLVGALGEAIGIGSVPRSADTRLLAVRLLGVPSSGNRRRR